MGHHQGRNRQWAQHGTSGGPPWGGGGWGRSGGHGGPPPWVAGLFGMGQPDQRRGPRVRRGDVRSAILDVLRTAHEANDGQGEPINGYQVIQQIAARSHDAWRPSPGSVYPTIQQLQDEGLVAEDEERGRRTLRLTDDGATHVRDNAEALAAVWEPFESSRRGESRSSGSKADYADLKPEIGQVMSAVWQIVSSGSDQQRRAAIDILVETRRKLYGVLADGHETDEDDEEEDR